MNVLYNKFLSSLPKHSRFLQDPSHQLHLALAVAESQEGIQVVDEEAAIHMNENLIHHKRSHDAQWAELLLSEHACVHSLWRNRSHLEIFLFSNLKSWLWIFLWSFGLLVF